MPRKPNKPLPPRPDAFLQRHLQLCFAAFLAIVFILHIRHASIVYLNPDEALHYQLAHQKSWSDAYAANNTNAHPPLLILTLHAMLSLGNSEVFLRLLPIVCAICLAWFAFQWGSLIAGPPFGFALAALAALLPPVWNLATELRHYLPALCFAAGALYFFDSALARASLPRIVLSTVSLMLAVLSNYSVLWFCAAFGVYSLFRIWKQEPPRPLIAVWAAGQTATAATYAWLYVSHIAELARTEMSKSAKEGWMASFYCANDTVNCLVRNTNGLWAYMLGSPELAIPGAALFLAGIALLWKSNRALLLLIGVHFGVCIAGTAAGLYPFGGTRHSVILALPIAIPIAIAITRFARRRLDWTIAATALFSAAIWLAASPDSHTFLESKHTQPMAQQAAAYLQESVPPGGLVFTTHQSMLLLCYYANRNGYCQDRHDRNFWSYDFGRFRVIASKVWSPSPDLFVKELKMLKSEYQLPRGAEVWVFDGGWGLPLGRTLVYRFTETVLPGLREFGPSLTVFRLPN